jgi:hypothetical protein
LNLSGQRIESLRISDAAQRWFNKNDPGGVAFMYPVEGAEEFEALPSIAPGS